MSSNLLKSMKKTKGLFNLLVLMGLVIVSVTLVLVGQPSTAQSPEAPLLFEAVAQEKAPASGYRWFGGGQRLHSLKGEPFPGVSLRPATRFGGNALIELGLEEGPRNVHPGQGTSNRRFFFEQNFLEFLWVHNEAEAQSSVTAPTQNKG
jgi:hypothetical protein